MTNSQPANEFKSSVLRCNIDEDGCPVCEFLNGSRDVEHLVEVIRILDAQLADAESHITYLATAIQSFAASRDE